MHEIYFLVPVSIQSLDHPSILYICIIIYTLCIHTHTHTHGFHFAEENNAMLKFYGLLLLYIIVYIRVDRGNDFYV